MACGTPAIAFMTGGVPEIIDHNQNGWLVKQKDTKGLVDGLKIAMENPLKLKRWAQSARKKVEVNYNREIFLKRHIELYRKVLTSL